MRKEDRNRFIAACGWGDAEVTSLPADASRRRYFRLQRENEPRLLMDMPRHPEEKFDAYLLIAAHLRAIGLSAPEVFAADAAQGFALIEDFGDDTYTRLLNTGHDAAPLYQTAIAAMVQLQQESDGSALALPSYDAEAMTDEISWFIDWYAPVYWGRVASAAERGEFQGIVRGIFDALPPLKPVLLLRDFHVDNFMWLPDRPGVKACGVLDFQDAKWGSPAYDLVSILEDARRDIDPALAEKLYDRYLRSQPYIDKKDFAAHYAAMAMLRHARVLGFLIRVWVRDNKPRYLEFHPRVLRQFQNALAHPIAQPLRDWCAQRLPDLGENWPEKDVLELRKVMIA